MPNQLVTPHAEATPSPAKKKPALTFSPPDWVMDQKDGLARRQALGRKICDMIDADKDLKNSGSMTTDAEEVNLDSVGIGLSVEWDDIDDLYLGRDIESLEPPYKDAPTYNLKTMRNKIDGIVSHAVVPLFTQMPYFILRKNGPTGAKQEKVQMFLHQFMAKGKWETAAKTAGKMICRRGRALIRPRYRPTKLLANGQFKAPRVLFDSIDIRNAVAYPNETSDIEEMRLIGHTFIRRVRFAEEMQAVGEFFNDCTIRRGAERLHKMGSGIRGKQTTESISRYTEDDPVEFFSGYVLLDLDGDSIEERYKVVVAYDQQELMMIEEYSDPRMDLANLAFDEELNQFYAEGSIGNILHDIHHWVNDMTNISVWGALYDSMRLIFNDGGMPGEALELKPGRMYSVEYGSNVSSPQGQASTNVFPSMITLAKQTADETARISQNGTGSKMPGSTTASEIVQVAEGQARGVNDYSQAFSQGACEVARIVLDLLYENFDDWKAYYEMEYGAPLDLKKEDFACDYWIEVNGETPMNTPAAVMQQTQMLLQGITPVLGLSPGLLQAFPHLPIWLLKSFVLAIQLPNKDELVDELDRMLGVGQSATQQPAATPYGPQTDPQQILATLAASIPGLGMGSAQAQGAQGEMPVSL